MAGLLHRLNIIALGILGVVLSCVLLAQIRPVARAADQAPVPDNKWGWPKVWPKTLQVYPSHPGDPVALVKIIKGDEEIVAGKYSLPVIRGDEFQVTDAVKAWLKDATFTVRSRAPKGIVSLGIAIVFPAREIGADCYQRTGDKTAPNAWCDSHPDYCEGGCADLIHTTLHWGRIPSAQVVSRLQTRFGDAHKEWAAFQGKGQLNIEPGQEIALSAVDRGEDVTALTDPRKAWADTMNGIVFNEGIEEATNTEPCLKRIHSKSGCALSEVSKFNIAIDVVYFDDGTIWGNYGFGYATPNASGIFTRVDGQGRAGEPEPKAAVN